ncbi:MAG: glycosyltransferase [Muribaculaceae bacterium]|nr:glycosyltransferase [Muribaculaceae bacterium]
MLFSIIVPVYNRRDEVADLLRSLESQTDKGFEIILVEDGSTQPSLPDGKGPEGLRLKYYQKSNEGRSIARNYGIAGADGDYFIFVDSDCILPPRYIASLRESLAGNPVDCFGGPDAAHDSFSDTQKAINYAMTSFLTTGGIRGGKVSMEKFTPRTFNMGYSREVFEHVGGFREMFSEDIDMSTRIRNAGFKIALFPDVYVYHKRRVDLKKFWKQVHVFGMSRITLELLYPGSMKLVHWLPAVFTVGAALLIMGCFFRWWFIIPLVVYILALWIGGLYATRSLKIASMGVVAAMVQLTGYGTGFIKAYVNKIILKKGRDIAQEVEIRKGSNEGL